MLLAMQSAEPSIEALLADPAQQCAGRAVLRAALETAPSTANYLKYAKRLPGFVTRRTIGVIASFTIETIDPFLAVEAYISNWRVAPIYRQYARWQRALLDPTSEFDQETAALVLLLDDKTVIEQLGTKPAEARRAIEDLLRGYRGQSDLPIFLGLVPQRPALHAASFGQDETLRRVAAIQAVNIALTEFCASDHAAYAIDIPSVVAHIGSAWHDPTAFSSNLSLFSHKALPAMARGLARTVGGLFVARRKVLVTDLDETLWGGILGEDGPSGILTGPSGAGRHHFQYQGFLRQLRSTGVLLAIASKNDEADVRNAFTARSGDMAIDWSDFASHRVDWTDKSSSLTQISEELGVGLDSFVFVDNSPFECARIREALPMVVVVQAPKDAMGIADDVLSTRAFDVLTILTEDRGRAESYKIERARAAARTQAFDIGSFYSSLDMTLDISSLSAESGSRIHQLLMKTNQFHLTLERPTLTELEQRAEAGAEIYVASLRDRFGDYGMIGVIELAVNSDRVDLRNMAISCRALGRLVEESLIAFTAERGRARGAKRIVARHMLGPRNHLVGDSLKKLGFRRTRAVMDTVEYELAVSETHPAWPSAMRRAS